MHTLIRKASLWIVIRSNSNTRDTNKDYNDRQHIKSSDNKPANKPTIKHLLLNLRTPILLPTREPSSAGFGQSLLGRSDLNRPSSQRSPSDLPLAKRRKDNPPPEPPNPDTSSNQGAILGSFGQSLLGRSDLNRPSSQRSPSDLPLAKRRKDNPPPEPPNPDTSSNQGAIFGSFGQSRLPGPSTQGVNLGHEHFLSDQQQPHASPSDLSHPPEVSQIEQTSKIIDTTVQRLFDLQAGSGGMKEFYQEMIRCLLRAKGKGVNFQTRKS